MSTVKQKTVSTDIVQIMHGLGQKAKQAAVAIAAADTEKKNRALSAIADLIEQRAAALQQENNKDMKAAHKQNLDVALLDRLELTPDRIQAMAEGLRQIAALPDPIGGITDFAYRPSGIQVGRMRVPLGVIAIIYESRPNVTADAAGLCLKSGNAAILRGGSEAIHSNLAIAACIQEGLSVAGLPTEIIQVVELTDREAVGAMLGMPEYIDVIVPRGGKGLIERISNDSKVPVIKHLHGVCHVYIDDEADTKKAIAVAFNAKTQRYGTCNTMETLLVAQPIAGQILPELAQLYKQEGVELRGCKRTLEILADIKAASESDWHEEYLAPILSIRVVDDIEAAMNHIQQYSSNHTESICTENIKKAKRFLREVDSSSVMVNASTRFADGFEYGLGAEIGISTDKLHVRGPVGLEGLTTQKYIVVGDGHIRK